MVMVAPFAEAAERCQPTETGDSSAPGGPDAPREEPGGSVPSALEADARAEAAADPKTPGPGQVPTAAETLGRTPRRVKCLDESLVDELGRSQARKGVQPRFFRKARRVALSIGGGGYAGDLLDTQWQAGGNLAFWISEDFGIDADFKVTPKTFRFERAATETINQQDRYPDGVIDNLAYITMAHLLWAPMHTKLRASEERILHGDFVLFGGGGIAFHDAVKGVGFDLGISLYLYPSKFMSVRFDLSDQILSEEVYGSRRISNNLVFSAGVGLWIPFRLRD